MAEYDYIAFDYLGERQEGRLEAPNLLDAVKVLQDRKWLVKNIDDAGAEFSAFAKINPASYFVTSRDLEISFTQLATLLQSGVNMLAALNILSTVSLKQAVRDLWSDVSIKVRSGTGFSEALLSHPKLRRSMLIQLIKIGEETGEIDEVLLTIAKGMERNREVQTKILGALMYPAFVLLISMIAAAIAVFQLIPKLEILIAAMGRELHPVTQLLVDIADFITRNMIMGLTVSGCLIVAFIITFTSRKGRLLIDRLLLKLPFIGNIFRVFFTAELARNMGILIKSGVKLTESLKMSADATWNRFLKSSLQKARSNIINGATLAETIAGRYAYTPMFINMVTVGERAGSLDTLLDEQSTFHYALLDKYISKLSTLLSFFMVCTVAGTIAFVFAAILLTYFG